MKISTKEAASREQSRKYKTLIKNDLKRFKFALGKKNSSNNSEEILKLLKDAQRNIDKSVSKKIIHKNGAARKKSSLFKLLNSTRE